MYEHPIKRAGLTFNRILLSNTRMVAGGFAGLDPAKLLAKYPDRWSMLHIKDMLKDFTRGGHTGGSPATAKVAVGEGQIQWAEVLNAAHKIGVKHYFLEDETVMPLKSIPDSFKYLRALKL